MHGEGEARPQAIFPDLVQPVHRILGPDALTDELIVQVGELIGQAAREGDGVIIPEAHRDWPSLGGPHAGQWLEGEDGVCLERDIPNKQVAGGIGLYGHPSLGYEPTQEALYPAQHLDLLWGDWNFGGELPAVIDPVVREVPSQQ
jgi:hypothetical protein